MKDSCPSCGKPLTWNGLTWNCGNCGFSASVWKENDNEK